MVLIPKQVRGLKTHFTGKSSSIILDGPQTSSHGSVFHVHPKPEIIDRYGPTYEDSYNSIDWKPDMVISHHNRGRKPQVDLVKPHLLHLGNPMKALENGYGPYMEVKVLNQKEIRAL